MAYRALLVGFSVYKELHDLPQVNIDLDMYRKVLERSIYDYVITQIDDHIPNYNNILNALHLFFDSCTDDDTVFMYWGGHGTSNVLKTFEDDISIETIQSMLNGCRAYTFLGLFDTCYSGNIEFHPTRGEAQHSQPHSMAFNMHGKGKVIITSCLETQSSYNHDECGLFSYCVIEGLDGAAQDQNGDITIGSLYTYICKRMTELALQKGYPPQTPVKMGIEEGDMLINHIVYYQSSEQTHEKVKTHPSFRYMYGQLSKRDIQVLKSDFLCDHTFIDYSIFLNADDCFPIEQRPTKIFAMLPIAICSFYVRNNFTERFNVPEPLRNQFPCDEEESCIGYRYIPNEYFSRLSGVIPRDELALVLDNLIRLNIVNDLFEQDYKNLHLQFATEFCRERGLRVAPDKLIVKPKTFVLTDLGVSFLHYVRAQKRDIDLTGNGTS